MPEGLVGRIRLYSITDTLISASDAVDKERDRP